MNSKKALERALRALESDRKQLDKRTQAIDGQIAGLRSMMGRAGGSGSRRKRKPMTAAQKKRMSAAMKKAWARRKNVAKKK